MAGGASIAANLPESSDARAFDVSIVSATAAANTLPTP
jgi:hypothetical protein